MLFVTADDYGVSATYSKEVLALLAENRINSVSFIVNEESFEQFALDLNPYLDSVKLNCHLNIFEGRPLYLSKESPLVNKNGYFHLDIKSLTGLYVFSSRKKKTKILKDIGIEFEAQVKCFLSKFPKLPLSLDSHQHVHLLPFVFPIVDELGNRYRATDLRLGESLTSRMTPTIRIFSRKILFNFLVTLARRRSTIPARSEYIFGVNELNSWDETMFRSIHHQVKSNPQLNYELITHPSWKDVAEIDRMDPQANFINHYLSQNRHIENFLIRENPLND